MTPNLHDEIAKVAFSLYQKEGCPEGRELIHWLEAEIIVNQKYAEKPEDASGGPAKPDSASEKKTTKSRPGRKKKR